MPFGSTIHNGGDKKMSVMLMILIVIILLLVLFGWIWHSLGSIEKPTKFACIIGGLVVVFIVTFVIYNISKIGITYENKESMKLVQNVFVSLFTIINSYIILPYVFKKLEQINNDEIQTKQLKKSIIILVIIILIVGIFESSYLGSIQEGILSMMSK